VEGAGAGGRERGAWLAGYGYAVTDSVGQTVTVPAGCAKAILKYWLHIDTAESGTTVYDTCQVKVNGTAKQTYSNADATTGYTERTLDLGQYAGRQITLTFTATEDSGLRSSFVIDDATLTTG
jgi:aminopeptidase S